MPKSGSLRELDAPLANELLFRGGLWKALEECFSDLGELNKRQSPVIPIVQARIDAAAEIARDAPTATEALSAGVHHLDKALAAELTLSSRRPQEEVALLDGIRRLCVGAHAADPFDALFAKVAELAEALYGEDWPTLGPLSTRIYDARGAKYGVSAYTEPVEAAGDPVPVVLRIDPTVLTIGAYAAIPAILIHECVCHVATWDPTFTDNGSCFAEGFMDYAAEYYRNLWSVPFGQLGPFMEAEGDRYFRDVDRRGGRLGVARRRGRGRADALARRFARQEGVDLPDAARRVATLAVELNRVDRRLSVKDAFVAGLSPNVEAPIDETLIVALKGLTAAADVL